MKFNLSNWIDSIRKFKIEAQNLESNLQIEPIEIGVSKKKINK